MIRIGCSESKSVKARKLHCSRRLFGSWSRRIFAVSPVHSAADELHPCELKLVAIEQGMQESLVMEQCNKAVSAFGHRGGYRPQILLFRWTYTRPVHITTAYSDGYTHRDLPPIHRMSSNQNPNLSLNQSDNDPTGIEFLIGIWSTSTGSDRGGFCSSC